MSNPREGLARSVQVRLARHAREIGVDPNLVLTRYAVERFLYRLPRSPHAERFVLKGALLMLVWLGEKQRPTSDADLLGFGELKEETLERIVGEVASQAVEADAVCEVRPGRGRGATSGGGGAGLGPPRSGGTPDAGQGSGGRARGPQPGAARDAA